MAENMERINIAVPSNLLSSNHTTLPSTSERPSPLVNLHSAGSNRTRSSQSVGRRLAGSEQRRRPSPDRVQELVHLDNPRPGILRTTNEYVSVVTNPPCPDNPNQRRHHVHHRNERHNRMLSSPSNFDRPKVHLPASASRKQNISAKHHHHSSNQKQTGPDLREFGEIKPLVQAAEIPPPLPLRAGGSLPKNVFSSIKAPKSTLHSSASLPRLMNNRTQMPLSNCRPNTPNSLNSSRSTNIICPNCSRCRCTACTQPRQIPSTMICNQSMVLSTDSIVDCVSCMCCVRGVLYHCTNDPDSPQPITDEELLSCDDGDCCRRWTCLSLAALCLPCIWCYLPLKACALLCAAGYARLNDHGCRCERRDDRSTVINSQPTKDQRIIDASHLMNKTFRHSSQPTVIL